MNNIIWKDIKGYEGLYQVSNTGEVKSLSRLVKNFGFQEQRNLKFLKHSMGYSTVALSKDAKVKQFLVHRLVAIAFIENHNNKKFINHISGIKTDNRIENLEWVTSKENNAHSRLIIKTFRTRSKIVLCLSNNETYSSAKEASEKLNLCHSQVAKVCKGKGNHAAGLKFKYA